MWFGYRDAVGGLWFGYRDTVVGYRDPKPLLAANRGSATGTIYKLSLTRYLDTQSTTLHVADNTSLLTARASHQPAVILVWKNPELFQVNKHVDLHIV